jgi:ribosome-binding factor A
MSQRRTAKVAQAIRQVVSSAILFELRDPRVKQVTVIGVEVPSDLRSAKVAVSVLGEAKDARLCLQGLDSARGFLQKKIADELDLRYTPILTFVVDDGVKKSIEASQLLRDIQKADRAAAGVADDEIESDDEEEFEKYDDEQADEPDHDSG